MLLIDDRYIKQALMKDYDLNITSEDALRLDLVELIGYKQIEIINFDELQTMIEWGAVGIQGETFKLVFMCGSKRYDYYFKVIYRRDDGRCPVIYEGLNRVL